jgi:hypothetical protein
MKIMKEKDYKKYIAKVKTKDQERVLVISDHGSYAIARECFHTSGKKEAKLKWINERKLCVSDSGRVFCDHKPNFYMDAITGSLYKNGKCLGSPNLTVSGLTENQGRATSILLSLKAENASLI